jgi:hypothetical protein
MVQIFFISPTGAAAVKAALAGINGQRTHGWRPDGDDKQVIGVAEVLGSDPSRVCDALEKAGIMVLPNHKSNEVIAPEHASALAKHGVLPADTTKQALTKIHGVSGFPPLKPGRF